MRIVLKIRDKQIWIFEFQKNSQSKIIMELFYKIAACDLI